MTADSVPRQPICRFTFPEPPHSACRFTCVCRVVPVRSLWDLPWNVIPRSGHACEAPRVVLRGFVNLPLSARGQHYVVYLSFTTGGGGSVSLITRGLCNRVHVVVPNPLAPHPWKDVPAAELETSADFLQKVVAHKGVTSPGHVSFVAIFDAFCALSFVAWLWPTLLREQLAVRFQVQTGERGSNQK